jgi:hypothetical protein
MHSHDERTFGLKAALSAVLGFECENKGLI